MNEGPEDAPRNCPPESPPEAKRADCGNSCWEIGKSRPVGRPAVFSGPGTERGETAAGAKTGPGQGVLVFSRDFRARAERRARGTRAGAHPWPVGPRAAGRKTAQNGPEGKPRPVCCPEALAGTGAKRGRTDLHERFCPTKRGQSEFDGLFARRNEAKLGGTLPRRRARYFLDASRYFI